MRKWIIIILILAVLWAVVMLTGAPVWTASVASVAAIAGLSGLFFWRRFSARRAAREIERMLRSQGSTQAAEAQPEARPEIDAMRGELDRAVKSLKASKLGKRGYDALYALPWFVIVGPPGAGKTTALRESGLHFPFMSGQQGGIRGVGGTRNCDWWLCNEGILLDTAGRYTTEVDDQGEWFAFLDTLREHRSRKPINGAIVAIPIDELGSLMPGEIAASAKQIRARLDELSERLDMRVPVYVLFTKADLVPGFVETFGVLTRSERAQIWGVTASIEDRPEDLEFFVGRQFDALLEQVEVMSLARIAAIRKIEDRELVLSFPQQLQALRGNIASFIGAVFSDNVFQDTPQLRGFYLTSGVQEGRPVDRVMSAMADAFGIASTVAIEESRDSKSYFLTDVFSKVIFPDQDLAVRSDSELRRARRRRLLVAGGILTGAGLTMALPGNAYLENRAAIERAHRAAREIGIHRAEHPEDPVLPPERLQRLQAVVAELRGLDSWDRMRMSFGMYSGDELLEHSGHLYGSIVGREILAPMLAEDIEAQQELVNTYRADALGLAAIPEELSRPGGEAALDQKPPPRLDYASFRGFHDKLRLHLMLTLTEGDVAELIASGASETEDERGADRREGEAVVGSMDSLDQPSLNDPREQAWLRRRAAERWLARGQGLDVVRDLETGESIVGSFLELAADDPEFYLEHLDSRREAMVDGVRGVLRREVLHRRQVEGIEELCRRPDYDLTLRDIMGSVTNITSAARVRGVYTRRGWEDCVRASVASRAPHGWIGGDVKLWVLGVTSVEEATELDLTSIRHAYLDSYADEWRAFLRSILVERPSGHEHALLMLHDLTGGGVLTPYARLFRVVDYNARLDARPRVSTASGTDEVDDDGALATLGGALGASRRVSRATEALQRREEVAAEASDARPYVLRLSPHHIRDAFNGFARFGAPPHWQVSESDGETPPPAPVDLDIYVEQLSFARDAVQEILDDPGDGDKLIRRLQGVRTRVRDLIERQEAPWRPRFEALLWPPIEGLTGSTSESIAEGLSRRWCSDVVVYWDREMAGRYPFKARSLNDVKLDDLKGFFHPNEGTLWRFYEETLKSQIIREGDHFVFARRLGRDYDEVFDPAVLDFLTAALDVTNAMFPPGSDEAVVELGATLLPSPDIQQISLTMGEQSLVHQNGPERTNMLRWATDVDDHSTKIAARGLEFQEHLGQDGSWGLFRLLERGDVSEPSASGAFTVTWTFRDQKKSVRVRVRPARTVSPFYGVVGRGSETFLGPLRAKALTIPRRLSRTGALCPRLREAGTKRR